MTALLPPRATTSGATFLVQYPSQGNATWHVSFVASLQAATNPTETIFRHVVTPPSGPLNLNIPTTNWVQGPWHWQVRSILPDAVTMIASGETQVWPGSPPSDSTGPIDMRTVNERNLARIREMLANWTDTNMRQQASISGRSWSSYSLAEVRELENEYALRVRNERLARGLPVPSRYLTFR